MESKIIALQISLFEVDLEFVRQLSGCTEPFNKLVSVRWVA